MNRQKRQLPELHIEDSSAKALNYFLVFMSIAQCGIGFLASKEINAVMAVVLTFVLLLKPGRASAKVLRALPWVLVNILIYIFQSIRYDAFDVSVVQLLYFAIRFALPAMYLVIIGKDYFKYYINIIYGYSIISFVFWAIAIFIPSLDLYLRTLAIVFSRATGSLVVEYKNISFFLIHTFTTQSGYHIIPRNAGPFWEPGAFAVYLTVAMVMLFLKTRSVKSKYMNVLAIAMISTQSTAGYLSLFLFYGWAIFVSRSKYKGFLLIVLVIVGFYLYSEMDFLGDKVSSMYEQQSTQDLSGFTSGRFYSARKSIRGALEFPIIGRGISRRTDVDEYSEFYGSYGIIDIPRRFGMFVGSLYFFLLILSLRYYEKERYDDGTAMHVMAAFIILSPVYFSQGVYLSVVNLLIVETVLVQTAVRVGSVQKSFDR